MHLTDCMYDAMYLAVEAEIGQPPDGAAQLNDLIFLWLAIFIDNPTAPPHALPDMWSRFYDSQSVPDGSRNDRARAWLESRGHTGDINDMMYQFWCEGGGNMGPFGYSMDWNTNPLTEVNEEFGAITIHFPTIYLNGTWDLVVSGVGAPDIERNGILTAPGGDFIVGDLDCSGYENGSVSAVLIITTTELGPGLPYQRNVLKVARVPVYTEEFSGYPDGTPLEDIPGWSLVDGPAAAVQVQSGVLRHMVTNDEASYVYDAVVVDPAKIAVGWRAAGGAIPLAGCWVHNAANCIGGRVTTAGQFGIFSRTAGAWVAVDLVNGQPTDGVYIVAIEDGDITGLADGDVIAGPLANPYDVQGALPGIQVHGAEGDICSEWALWDLSIIVDHAVPFFSQSATLHPTIVSIDMEDAEWHWADGSISYGDDPGEQDMSLSSGNHELLLPEPLKVTEAYFNDITDLQINGISNIFNVETLMLHGSTALTGDIFQLDEALLLEDFRCYNTAISGSIAVFADKNALTDLFIYGTNIAGDISYLTNLVTLVNLRMQGLTGVVGDIADLSGLVLLDSLYAPSTGVTGDILVLSNFPGMRFVQLDDTTLIGNIGVLESTPDIVIMNLNDSGVSGAIEDWSGLIALTVITLQNTGVLNTDVNLMVVNMHLNRVMLGGNALSANLSTSGQVDIETHYMIAGLGDYLGDGLVQAGCDITYTEPTYAEWTEIPFFTQSDAIAPFLGTDDPNWIEWRWADGSVDFGPIPSLKNMSGTDGNHTLMIRYPDLVTDANFAGISDLVIDLSLLSNLTSLTSLRLENTNAIGDIANLTGLTALVTIQLQNTDVTGNLSSLTSLVALQLLYLHNTAVIGDIADVMLPALEHLYLLGTSCEGDLAVVNGMANLVNLRLENTNVSGAITDFSGLTSLLACQLQGTNITNVGANTMIENMWDNRVMLGANGLAIVITTSAMVTVPSHYRVRGIGPSPWFDDGLVQAGINTTYTEPDYASWTVVPFFTQDPAFTISITGTGYAEWHYADGSAFYGTTPGAQDMSDTDGNHELWIQQPTQITELRFGAIADLVLDLADIVSLVNVNYIAIQGTESVGNISELASLPLLEELYSSSNNITGDIASVAGLTAMKTFYVFGTALTGDISIAAAWPDIEVFRVEGTDCDGDIVAFNGKANLRNLYTHNSDVSGAITDFSGLTSLVILWLHGTGVAAADVDLMVVDMWDNRVMLGANALDANLTTIDFVTTDTHDRVVGMGEYEDDGLVQAGCTIEFSAPAWTVVPFFTQWDAINPMITLSSATPIEWHWADGSIDYTPDPGMKNMAGTSGEHELWVADSGVVTSWVFNAIFDLVVDLADLAQLTNITIIGLNNTDAIGDLADISGLTELINLNIMATDVTGDIASLAPLTAMIQLNVQNNAIVTGDIVVLTGFSSLRVFYAHQAIGLTGNIWAATQLSELEIFVVGSIPGVMGEISDWSNKLNMVNFDVSNSGVFVTQMNNMIAAMWEERIALGANVFAANMMTANPLSADSAARIEGTGDYAGDGLHDHGSVITYNAP